MVVGMAPTTYASRVTVEYDPPLTDPAAQLDEHAQQYADALPRIMGGAACDWTTDGRSASFVATIHGGEHALDVVTDDVIRAAQILDRARVVAVEVLDAAERDRRLTEAGWPVPGAAQPTSMTGLESLIPGVPAVVNAADFAVLCDVTPARIRQLRSERRAADEEGREHPFPAEYMPGFHLLTDAEAWRDSAARRGTPGRPRKSTDTEGAGT